MLILWAGAAAARALTGTSVTPGGRDSTTARAVTTLVRLAGGSGVRSLPASMTFPVSASTAIQALGGGSGTVVRDGDAERDVAARAGEPATSGTRNARAAATSPARSRCDRR